MRRGLLLINLGTPKNPTVPAVKRYLRAFLTDKRVVDLPAWARYILIHAFILPFRSKRSAQAYQSIWTEKGSPLLIHSKALAQGVQKKLGEEYVVSLAMRYGEPSLEQALDQLKHCTSITILPLYPQYSSAATGSSLAKALQILSTWEVIPSLHIIRDFFQHSAYIHAQATCIKKYLPECEHVLFSYHGIPERQVARSGCTLVCSDICPSLNDMNQSCYKAQCHHSSYLLAQELGLAKEQYTTAFQSRLGKTPWIKPYTDEVLHQLAAQGIKKLIVVCPSFVADCLETLEEIGMRAQSQWRALGGIELILVPCLNANPLWVQAITQIIQS